MAISEINATGVGALLGPFAEAVLPRGDVRPVDPIRRRQDDGRGTHSTAEAPNTPELTPTDVVELSPAAQRSYARQVASESAANESETRDATSTTQAAELSEEEQQQVDELKQRDTEVRAHEQAHQAAAGAFSVGGATFEYETGPDGQRYAVGGEVQIDTSPIQGDPEATIRKMQQVRAAALAPAEPSSQDRSVAQKAARAIAEAEAELAKQQGEAETTGASTDTPPTADSVKAYSATPALASSLNVYA